MDWFWRQRRRRKKAAILQAERLLNNPLREFVYLDEVSITSLVSSLLGKVPSEFTDTSNVVVKAQRNVGFDTDAGPIKVKLGFGTDTTRTDDAKVQSKATIQALFKRLHQEVKSTLLTIPPGPKAMHPTKADIERALRGVAGEATKQWIVEPAQLQRGSLVELQVELQADPIFRLSAMVSTFTDLVEEGSKTFRGIDENSLRELSSTNAILEKLMAGLVPLKCRIVDYLAIATPQGETLIHRSAYEILASQKDNPAHNVFLVGVVERSSFWKDIRRVLFSGSHFRVLCRLNDDGVTREWTAVKLAHMFSEVAPTFRQAVEQFSLDATRSFPELEEAAVPEMPPAAMALIRFGQLLADRAGIDLNDEVMQKMASVAVLSSTQTVSVDRRRAEFAQISNIVLSDENELNEGRVPAEELSRLRMQAMEEYGLLPGQEPTTRATAPLPTAPQREEERYIDAEIVAIYW
ncbi:hypothetical protein [Dactylosporangium sp. NPDC048998]|uniref:DUF6414 family protein n=1 Tax=Dactylosporangium sp. NPDC048998 TaxID=3363976 RepID=UPI00370F917E